MNEICFWCGNETIPGSQGLHEGMMPRTQGEGLRCPQMPDVSDDDAFDILLAQEQRKEDNSCSF